MIRFFIVPEEGFHDKTKTVIVIKGVLVQGSP